VGEWTNSGRSSRGPSGVTEPVFGQKYCLLHVLLCYYSLAMDIRAQANDISTLLPILVLIAFLIIPYVLKMLGRYTAASKREELPGEHGTHGEPPLYEDHQGPVMRQDYEQFDRSSPSNRPITPKWF